MSAINTSLSYQSQFAPSNTGHSDFRAKSDARSQMEFMKELDLKPVSHKYYVQIITTHGEYGEHVNLKA